MTSETSTSDLPLATDISDETRRRLENLLEANTTCFLELVRIAELDPKKDFRFKDLRELDLRHLDLTDFDFTDSDLSYCDVTGTRFSRHGLHRARLNGIINDRATIDGDPLRLDKDGYAQEPPVPPEPGSRSRSRVEAPADRSEDERVSRAAQLAEQWATLANDGRFEREIKAEAAEVLRRTPVHVELKSYDHVQSSYDVERREVLSVALDVHQGTYGFDTSDPDQAAVICNIPVVIEGLFSVSFEFQRKDPDDEDYWVYGLPQINRAIRVPGVLKLMLDSESLDQRAAAQGRIMQISIPDTFVDFGEEVDPEAEGGYESLRI